MTDNEIIKALECCPDGCGLTCGFCPLSGVPGCSEQLYTEALDLINRQKTEIDILISKKETLKDEVATLRAENEKLTVELVGMRGACESYKMHYDKTQADIKRLREGVMFERERVDAMPNLLSQSYAYSIKEFWNRLKQEADYISGGDYGFSFEIREDVAEGIIKELAGEQNER